MLRFIEAINTGMSYLVLVFFVFVLLAAVAYYTVKQIRSLVKKGQSAGRGIFLGVVALLEAAVFGLLILGLPQALAGLTDAWKRPIPAAFFRWILLFILIPGIAYIMFRKYRGRQAALSMLLILAIALFGWWYNHWIGILFLSVPIYTMLILLVYRMAQVILPASLPGDKHERWQKFRAFLFYTLGVNYPFWTVKSSAGREIEKRVDGDYFSELAEPGLVWSRSHQVVGISAGIQFDQVEGPGLVFTRTYNRPVAVMDLRTQIRTAELDATTRDGVPIRVVVFTSFAIDKEDWPKKDWKAADRKRLPAIITGNPYMANGLRLDRKIGSFPYSTARVRAALSTAGVRSAWHEQGGNDVYWDQWVVVQVEHAARQVVSQRNLTELWHPHINGPDVSALDEMAAPIYEAVEPRLRQVGIRLYGARIVNFKLDPNSAISRQQIETWKSMWTQKIRALESEAAAIYKEEIEKAHAYAKSAVLDAIAEGIEKARQEHPDLPRHVIAVYYIHSIEEFIQKQPEAQNEEARQRFETIRNYLMYNQ